MSRNRILGLCFLVLLAGLALFGFNTPSANAQTCTPSYFIGDTGSKDATQVGTQIKVTYEIYFQDSVDHYDLKRNTVNDKNTATSIHVFTVTSEQETYIFDDSGPFTSGVTYYYWLQPFDAAGCSQIADWLGPVDEKFQGATAVEIEDFTTRRDPMATTTNIIEWVTVSEIGNQGFNIWQCPDGVSAPNASCPKLNTLMILSQSPGGPSGHSYQYDHTNGPYNARYWLEAIDMISVSDWYGPARWLTGPTRVGLRTFAAKSGGFLDHEWIQGVPNWLTGGLALSIGLLIIVVMIWRRKYFPQHNIAADFAMVRTSDGKFD